MTQPDAHDEDRAPPDVTVEPATKPHSSTTEGNSVDDDVEGHVYTGALKNRD